jgi:preprotein translocase subunit SecD
MIADAKVETNTYSQQPVIAVNLTDEGRSVFAAATRLHVGERIAVVVDGVVVTAPYIREPIEGGQVEIDGVFTPDSAGALVQKIVPYPSDLPLRIVEGDTAPQ